MLGGYSIHPLIELLDNNKLAPIAAEALEHTLLTGDAFPAMCRKKLKRQPTRPRSAEIMG